MNRLVALVLVTTLLSSCYSLKQAYHFNNLFNSRVKVEDALRDPTISDRHKKRLEFVQEVIKFAADSGLNTEGAYEYYIHTESGSVSFLVQAAERDKLRFKKWWFPIVGSVPYLGFFEKEDRDSKFEALSHKYDVAKGTVGAFSSLGWFEDPIYTSMIKRKPIDLAHLFFHELIHRTFWSSGSVKFNENLAEFGAEILTSQFLESRGEPSDIDIYFARRRDKEKFKRWLKSLQKDLRALYKSSKSRAEKLSRKEEIIESYKKNRLPNFETKRFSYIARKKWNNASILGASLYTPDTARFYKAYRCDGEPNLGVFFKKLESYEDEHDDVFVALDSFCQQKG